MNQRHDWAPVDWSPMKRLIYLRGNPATGGGGSPLTVTGATPLLMPGAVAKPMRKAEFAISPVQAGTGDPSPTNIRAISGHQSMTAWVTGRNLLNLNRTQGTPNPTGGEASVSTRVLNTDNYYVGLTRNNYYYPNYVTSFNITDNSVTLTIAGGGYGVAFPVSVVPGKKYTFSAQLDDGNLGFGYYDKEWNYISAVGAYTTLPTTITIPTNAAYCTITFSAVNINQVGTITNPMFEPGEVAHPYTPYSGSTVSVEFPEMGRNLYKATFPTTTNGGVTLTNNGDGSYTLNGTATNDVYFDIFKDVDLPNGSYKMTGCPAGGSTSSYYMYVRPSYTGDYGSGGTVNNNIIGGSIFVKSGYVVNNLTFWPMIQLADGAVNTFEPYTSIVYSGTIDPVTGEGVVTHKMVDLGSLTWMYRSTQQMFTANVSALYYKAAPNNTTVCNAISSAYKALSISMMLDNVSNNNAFSLGRTNNWDKYLMVRDTSYTDADAFKTAVTGVQMVYELNTPIPFTLSPQSLTPPAGDAYIWADCGGSAEVTYIGKA